jgi:hypothetical protein
MGKDSLNTAAIVATEGSFSEHSFRYDGSHGARTDMNTVFLESRMDCTWRPTQDNAGASCWKDELVRGFPKCEIEKWVLNDTILAEVPHGLAGLLRESSDFLSVFAAGEDQSTSASGEATSMAVTSDASIESGGVSVAVSISSVAQKYPGLLSPYDPVMHAHLFFSNDPADGSHGFPGTGVDPSPEVAASAAANVSNATHEAVVAGFDTDDSLDANVTSTTPASTSTSTSSSTSTSTTSTTTTPFVEIPQSPRQNATLVIAYRSPYAIKSPICWRNDARDKRVSFENVPLLDGIVAMREMEEVAEVEASVDNDGVGGESAPASEEEELAALDEEGLPESVTGAGPLAVNFNEDAYILGENPYFGFRPGQLNLWKRLTHGYQPCEHNARPSTDVLLLSQSNVDRRINRTSEYFARGKNTNHHGCFVFTGLNRTLSNAHIERFIARKSGLSTPPLAIANAPFDSDTWLGDTPHSDHSVVEGADMNFASHSSRGNLLAGRSTYDVEDAALEDPEYFGFDEEEDLFVPIVNFFHRMIDLHDAENDMLGQSAIGTLADYPALREAMAANPGSQLTMDPATSLRLNKYFDYGRFSMFVNSQPEVLNGTMSALSDRTGAICRWGRDSTERTWTSRSMRTYGKRSCTMQNNPLPRRSLGTRGFLPTGGRQTSWCRQRKLPAPRWRCPRAGRRRCVFLLFGKICVTAQISRA